MQTQISKYTFWCLRGYIFEGWLRQAEVRHTAMAEPWHFEVLMHFLGTHLTTKYVVDDSHQALIWIKIHILVHNYTPGVSVLNMGAAVIGKYGVGSWCWLSLTEFNGTWIQWNSIGVWWSLTNGIKLMWESVVDPGWARRVNNRALCLPYPCHCPRVSQPAHSSLSGGRWGSAWCLAAMEK